MNSLRPIQAIQRIALLALAVAANTALGSTAAGIPADMGRPFDRYSWVTSHNAFTSNGTIPNQSQTIDRQLTEGVRGLMLDLYYDQGRVRLCHRTCLGDSQTFADLVNKTLLPFLEREPKAIVSLHLEDFTSRRQLLAELERTPGLVGRTFDPYAWSTPAWPTYAEMVSSGQRILIFSLNPDNSGALMTRAGAIHVMPSEVFTVENYWSLGATIFQHDNECRSRWNGTTHPLSRREITEKPGWRPLFTMNQFHGVPLRLHASTDNRFERLSERYIEYCRPVARRKPNFVAVDFHERGDAAAFATWLTLWAPDAMP
jgi:chitinase